MKKGRRWKQLTAMLMMCLMTLTSYRITAEAASNKMMIVAIDLGRENTGEATMVSDEKGTSLLVDSGDNGNDTVFDWLNNNGYKNKKFNTLVTHWHDDHAGNTAEIIDRYNVGTVYLPPTDYVYSENTDYYRYERGYFERVIDAAKRNGTKVVYLKKGQTVNVGSVKGKVLSVNSSPKKENWYNVQYFNNQSAVIMFSGGGAKFLACGDIQEQTEKRLLRSGTSLKADIYKLSHHGYDGSNIKEFVDAVNPTYAWFTSYNATPSKFAPSSVIGSVARTGSKSNVMGTRYNGTITYVCSNGDIRVKLGRNYKKMYQRLINKETNTGKNVTIMYNKAHKIRNIKNVLNTDKYYNRQLNADGSMFSGKWIKKNGKYMAVSDGVYAYNTFARVNGRVYWFNVGGYRSNRGFINAYGRRYYMMPSRAIGFRTINGKKYYFMGKRYKNYKPYLEGMMMTGFKTISGKEYYFQNSSLKGYRKANRGKMMTGFFTVNGKTYYSGKRGMKGYKSSQLGVLQKGWKVINGRLYYLGNDGVVRKGWQTIGGKRYYMYPGGTTATNRFTIVNGKKYYFNDKGVLQTGMLTIGGKKYYTDKNGSIKKGFVTIDGNTYYFGDDGSMRTGMITVDGRKYYADKNGSIKKGLVTVGDQTYYFGDDGSMQTGDVEIDSITYHFDENGVLIGKDDVIPGKPGKKDAMPVIDDNTENFEKDPAVNTDNIVSDEETAEDIQDETDGKEESASIADEPKAEDTETEVTETEDTNTEAPEAQDPEENSFEYADEDDDVSAAVTELTQEETETAAEETSEITEETSTDTSSKEIADASGENGETDDVAPVTATAESDTSVDQIEASETDATEQPADTEVQADPADNL